MKKALKKRAKVVRKKIIKAVKATKTVADKPVDNKLLVKDLTALCKKHKLHKVALIAQGRIPKGEDSYYHLAVVTYIKGETKTAEQKYGLSLISLISEMGLTSESIDGVAGFLMASRKEKERLDAQRVQPEKKTNLSPAQQVKLETIQTLKSQYIQSQEYSKACQLREYECQLLGLSDPGPVASLDLTKEDLELITPFFKGSEMELIDKINEMHSKIDTLKKDK